jgi:hypothetical protein
MSVERNHQQSAQDTLRWGDVEAVTFTAFPSATDQLTKQLISARWRWPMTWKLAAAIRVNAPPGAANPITIAVETTLGSGQAQQTVFLSPLIVIPAPYLDVYMTFDVPAQDIQCRARVMFAGEEIAGSFAVQIGLFTAPITEAHAMTHVADGLSKDERFENEARQGGWMPPGFNPEPLGYHR